MIIRVARVNGGNGYQLIITPAPCEDYCSMAALAGFGLPRVYGELNHHPISSTGVRCAECEGYNPRCALGAFLYWEGILKTGCDFTIVDI
jgi:hypothetical protein